MKRVLFVKGCTCGHLHNSHYTSVQAAPCLIDGCPCCAYTPATNEFREVEMTRTEYWREVRRLFGELRRALRGQR